MICQYALFFIQLSVECVLGQRHNFFITISHVILTQSLHKSFTDSGFSRSRSTSHTDHEWSLDSQRHLATRRAHDLRRFCHFFEKWREPILLTMCSCYIQLARVNTNIDCLLKLAKNFYASFYSQSMSEEL